MKTDECKKAWVIMLIVAIVSMCNITNAFAVGSSAFENASLSTRSLAKGNAVVADPEKPDTVAFNPAGLARLKGTQIYSGGSLITSSVEYEGTEGRSDEGNSETVTPVPFLYASWESPIENLTLGVGANSPFGLVSKWDSVGNFRYIAHHNELKTQAYHLSAGYQVAPWLSVGAGWTHIDSKLKQVGKFNSDFITSITLGVLTGVPDSPFEFDVEGQGQGWNLGFLLTPSEEHTLGVFYRSNVRMEYEGYFSVDNITGAVLPTVFGGSTFRTSADTDIDLPYNITLGYNYKPNDKLDLEFDLGWTGWSSLDRQQISFGTTNAVLSGFERVNRDAEDTVSVHVGGQYDVTDVWSIMGGYLFYSMAINENNYDNVIPGGNRHAFSIGVEYKQKNWSIDLMYMFLFVGEEDISNTVGIGNGTDIDGQYSSTTHLLTLGLSYAI